ncbi:MAG: DUF4126 domain-containing protein [bacterium]|nr:DUF4126 domain-containing protein [bacterium]
MSLIGLDLALPQVMLAGAVGISLAAAVGFRIFAPMLLVSIAANTGHIHLASGFEWLGSEIAMAMLAIAAIAEITAYFFPFFDHLLDTLSGPVAMGAGTLLMASTLMEIDPWMRWAIALVAGGGTAGLIHSATSALRLGSTATTGGLGNPVFATMEVAGSTALTILAIVLPVAALVVVVFLLTRSARLLGRGWRKARGK